MQLIERDVVLTGQDEHGQATMDFPVTRLDLIEGIAEVKDAPGDGDYLPVMGADGKIKKVPFEALQETVNSGQSDASQSEAGLLSAEDKKKLDGIARDATKNEPSNTEPKPLGDADAGAESGFARGDHVHPLPSAADLEVVPTTRKINGKELGKDITLTAEDVEAAPADHTHTASDMNIKIFSAGTTEPSDKTLLWIDTTATTGGLKYYNGTAWVHVPVSTT